MSFRLNKISIGYTDTDGTEEEMQFDTATEAVEFINDNKDEIDFEDAVIEADFIENRIIHSASQEPLDDMQITLTVETLKEMADEEPTSPKVRSTSKFRMR